MKVLYNTCMLDPFLPVARRLWDDYGFEPVYWIGFTDPNSEKEVQRVLPGVPFQSYYDAWRGDFNEEINKKSQTCYLGVDILNELAHYEVQAYTMMNRLDINRYSFNTMERERHYLHLLKCWMACLELYKPDIVISAVVPHRVYDYVLYILCERLGIKFYIFNNTPSLEWTFVSSTIFSIGDLFENDYRKFLKLDISKDDLPADIRKYFENVVKEYDQAAPVYMKRHNKDDRDDRNIVKLFKQYYSKYHKALFAKSIKVNMYKKADKNWTESNFNAFELYIAKRNKIKYLDNLHELYNKLVSTPKEGEKYILVSLHYQPEATSCPAGDLYANQQLIIETLLANTPDDCFLYVKEHPQQLQSHMNGHTCRIKEFYSDIAANPRVKLMPLNLDSFYLMHNAMAVTTITGTVGWEAVMHKKPVIIFGMVWYEGLDCVYRVFDDTSAKGIMSFIENYKYDEHNILAYLMAFVKNSINCYHYTTKSAREHITQEVCVNNIVKALAELEK